MKFKINTEFAALADNDLTDYLTQARAAAMEALSSEQVLSVEELSEVEALDVHIDEVVAAQTERAAANEEREARLAALRDKFSDDTDEADEADEDAAEDEDAEDEETVDEAEEEVEAEPVKTAAKAKGVAVLAGKTKRPAKPARTQGKVKITAAADVPGFAASSALEDLSTVAEATISRMKGFATPTGNGETEDLRYFGVASFALDFPEDLTIKRGDDDMEVLTRAGKESRLPGNSLTAAAGWCAPSETIYDLCAGETAEGILSVPEVNVTRGGIKHTSGPDFSTIYSGVGFLQTEAQAIAGTTKACYEVPCPSFTDTRLDAIGICIKVPILLNSAYPEVTQRIMSGSMIAHQHKVNASVISRMVTYAGSARVFTGNGGTTADTMESIELVINQSRQKYALSFNHTLEVVVPFYAKAMYRADLGRRNGRPAGGVTDAEIASHFSAIGANVQYVYDWQALTTTDEAYAATYQALVYPSGTFVKGTSDVINLSAVYDAASLAVNTYTGLFFEQGLLVAQMCYNADLLTLPVCNAGRTGAANLTCA